MVKHRARLERAEKLGVAAVQWVQGQPLNQVAASLGVARSTLRGWRAAVPLAGLPAEVRRAWRPRRGCGGCTSWWW
ncbi:hypothetical protein [uncultured Thiodictyon sp.]|nr:hypothetical protein [uncultured Thiodictyon sp.]